MIFCRYDNETLLEYPPPPPKKIEGFFENPGRVVNFLKTITRFEHRLCTHTTATPLVA